MKSFVIGLLTLIVIVRGQTLDALNILDNILVHPVPAPMNIAKRETSQDLLETLNEFVEEKLTEHTQALEHILKILNHQEHTNKMLLVHLTKATEQPKLPVKIKPEIEAKQNTRRNNYEIADHPIFRIGKNIPKYGKLATDILVKEIVSDTDSTPPIQIDPDLPLKTYRRSFEDSQEVDRNIFDRSPWCELAILCKSDLNQICAFDDNFGYGKFDNICHMLHVNCYFKYNFVLVHTCQPTL